MNEKDLTVMYSTVFWYLLVILLVFWLYCITTVTPFIRRSQGWSLRSGWVLDQSQQKCRFFAEIQVCCKFFSVPTQERNLLFLSKRSARKKLYNFPIKLNHLCQTLRHVWRSSSACDGCCAYLLICIMTISTYTTGARAEMTCLLGSCTVKKWALAPVM